MTETDPNKIKAGKYVLTCLQWDEITSKPGQPLDFVRHVQGDEVDLDVAQARRLVLAGAVRKPGEVDKKAEVPGSGPSVAPDGPGDPAAGSDPAVPVPYDPGAEGETIDKVKEYVGTDVAVAAVVLELEKAGKNRSTLVEYLEALVNPPAE